MLGREIFRGVIVKDWYGVDDTATQYHDVNKILIYQCVKYYSKIWRERNVRRNYEVIRRKRLIDWATAEVNWFANHTNAKISKYLASFSDVRHMSSDAIQQWLTNLHFFKKNAGKEENYDIRSFFMPEV